MGRWRLVATPLFVVLALVETTDLIFAVDSIPAIFAVTQDPFLVYTSNVFAILGLRSLYFLMAGIIHRFHYLKLGLSVVLVFVGAKMLLTDVYKVPIVLSLGVIALILLTAVGASLLFPKAAEAHDPVVHDPLRPAPEPASGPATAPPLPAGAVAKGTPNLERRPDGAAHDGQRAHGQPSASPPEDARTGAR